jgi:periplasmic copper chaperone A
MLLARLGVVLTAVVTLVVGGGAVAVAHVTVHADQAVRGGAAEIAFRVPSESDTASTVSVQVAFPADTPIAQVAVLPVAGWTHQATKARLSAPVPAGHGQEVSEVVSRIEWRAAGQDTAVRPGEYQVFRIAASPLPDADRLVFKVVQTYDDGQVQRWIEEPAANGPEPEHPAPVLALSGDGVPAGHGHGEAEIVPVASTQATTSSSAWWATMAVALVAMAVALGSMVVTVRTSRRRGGDEPPS